MKIALICATPAGTNTGMISVDLAFDSIKEQLPDTVHVERFCGWKSIKKSESLKYTELYNISQLENFDKIIYWGDFLHWINYGENDWVSRYMRKNLNCNETEAIDKWYQLCLLEHRPDLQKKTIIFGNTIYGLTSAQLLNNRYLTALTELYSNTQCALLRDMLSATMLLQLTLNSNIQFGCDCALLLNTSKYTNNIVNNSSKFFLYSFARSGQRELLEQLTLDLGNKFNITPIELNWLHKGASVQTLTDKLNLIKQSEFVLTDIYHCSINSYREGTKVICIGNSAGTVTDTLSDKKKEIFHLQHFASTNYIFVENLKSNYNTEINNIIKIINNTQLNKSIYNKLTTHIAHTKAQLIESILS